MSIARALLAVLALVSCGVDAVTASESSTGGGVSIGRSGTPSSPEMAEPPAPEDAGVVASGTGVCADAGVCFAGVCCGGACCAIGQLCCNDVCLMPTLDRPSCVF